ncbi:helix-turn-helix domain-containing protein [Acidaminobacter hydrogenoformans]|uniref:Helix-turn-helix n=1 Tax=Acidaminobacter hydrogenoformans DSM 2784 TaxID=1120920 RepID=A0A1G5S6T7_9FIRM|nr:helix-turn-helix transcriptional regulator [Acidaminobacter hydrogenoformans]SCZ82084.1 hypothetical protein SAMN03080599_03341 [Acidaminobacter hydrogenoformans DSM 2784]
MTRINSNTKYSHRHEKIRQAMNWYGLSVKDLAKSLEISESALRRRLDGKVSFGMMEALKIFDTLKLKNIDAYFHPNYDGEMVISCQPSKAWINNFEPGMGVNVNVKDPWEVPHNSYVAIEIDGEVVAGKLAQLPDAWTGLFVSDSDIIEIKPEDIVSGKIIFLGQVKSIFKNFS